MVKQIDRVLDSHLISVKPERLIPASKLKRLLNLIFDYIGIVFSLAIALFFIAWMGGEEILMIGKGPNGNFWVRILGLSTMLIYYTICEYFFKGKTLGKMLTRTRTVTINGKTPTLKTIILRSLYRFIPFEFLSFFSSKSSGWHDRFSKTMVIEAA